MDNKKPNLEQGFEGFEEMKARMEKELAELVEKRAAGEKVDETKINNLVAGLNGFSREEAEDHLDAVEDLQQM